MGKKIFSIILTMALIVSFAFIMPTDIVYADSSYAGTIVASGSCGTNVNYTVYRVDADNYTLVISGSGDMDDYWNKTTGLLSRPWDSYSITELYVEDGIDTIGAASFMSNKTLKKAYLSDSISFINQYAFSDTGKIEQINLPENTVSIGKSAFYWCGRDITDGGFGGELVIPEGVSSISESAFGYANGVQSLSLPNTLKSIEYRAFENTYIENLVLPAKLTNLGNAAFYECYRLKTVQFPESLKTISESAFLECKALESISFAEGLQVIESGAFQSCNNLTTLDIPNSIETLGDKCFSYCKSLISVYFMGNAPTFYKDYNGKYTSFSNTSATLYYLADNPTWNSSNMPSGMLPWYNLETCDISYTETAEYNGSYIKPEVTISCAGQELEFGTQYTLRYANNKDVGTADIIITGIGECRGTVTKHFDITKKIENCNITIDSEAIFTGNEVKPNFTVSDGDKELVEGEDYSVSFINNIGIGTATAVFEGKGYYTDTVDKTFEIVESEHVWDEGVVTIAPTCTEDGVRTYTCKGCGEKKTEVIPSEGHQWSPDYTIDVAPTCNSKGSKSHHCTVCGAIQPGTSVEIDMIDHEYGDWVETISPTCTKTGTQTKTCIHCGKTITESIPAIGHDWNSGKITTMPTCTTTGIKTFTCLNCGDTYEEIIPANGHQWDEDYTIDKPATCKETGVKSIHCLVCDKIKSGSEVEIPKKDHNFTDWTVIIEPTCEEQGSGQYTCSACGDIKTEVIPAIGHNYVLTTNKATLSEDGSIDNVCKNCGIVESSTTIYHPATFTLSATSYTYTGGAKKPSVTITDADGNTISTANYSVAYSNNIKVGTATAKVTFKGEKYSGTKSLTFKIISKALSKTTISMSATSYTYDGSVKKPTVTVKDTVLGKTVTLVSGTDYTVAYATGRKNVGSYKVTIKGKGNYSGTVTKTFKINPKGTTLKTLTATSKGFKATWTKQATKMSTSYITGYEIQYSTSSTFASGNKTVIATKYSTVSKTISKLTAKKKYYVRIRTYKTVSGVKYYSPWSAKKYVTTKA